MKHRTLIKELLIESRTSNGDYSETPDVVSSLLDALQIPPETDLERKPIKPTD